jgi:hypothetical protein
MIDAAQFEAATGRRPEDDDLERVNCDKAGGASHRACGWNEEANLPRFMVLEGLRP